MKGFPEEESLFLMIRQSPRNLAIPRALPIKRGERVNIAVHILIIQKGCEIILNKK